MILGKDAPPEPSSHVTVLRMTNCVVGTITDDEDKVIGYRMVLHDTFERHTYHFNFGEELRVSLEEILASMSRVGQSNEKPDDQPEPPVKLVV